MVAESTEILRPIDQLGWAMACSGVTCANSAIAREWAVANHVVNLPAAGTHVLTLPAFVAWNEKPVLEHLVSAGIYLVEPRALEHLPRDTAINLPDFVVALDRAGCALRAYVHDGYWLDIGRHADYEQACRDVERLVLW